MATALYFSLATERASIEKKAFSDKKDYKIKQKFVYDPEKFSVFKNERL